MGSAKFACVLALLWSIAGCAQGTVYYPPECAAVCTENDYIESLPVENGPTKNLDNRAYVWAIMSMIQTQINLAGLSPPGVARIAGITGACLYEAANLLDQYEYTNIGHGFIQHHAIDRNAFLRDVLDGAGFWALRRMFGQGEKFTDVYWQYQNFAGERIDDCIEIMEEYVNYSDAAIEDRVRAHGFNRIAVVAAGAAVCERVIETYTADGFAPTGSLDGLPEPTGYLPFNIPQRLAGITDCDNEILDPNRWQPLCIPDGPEGFGTDQCMPQVFLYPWAGRFNPFALIAGDETMGDELVGPPPLYGTQEFTDQWEEVLDYSANLDDAQKIVAEYWADGPDTTFPPGHCFKIAADAAIKENLSVQETTRLLHIVGNAVYDAGIASWRTKTTYDLIRPLQMIQCGARGEERIAWRGPYQGVGLINASEWRPYQASNFVTPPFAAYTSGHSTFSAAAAEAMRLFFGSDVYKGPACDRVPEGESLFEPRSDAIPGVSDVPNAGPGSPGYVPAEDVVLCWSTFTEAADQAGISRLMGGIHIKADDTSGQRLGRYVGRVVYDKVTTMRQNGYSLYG